MIKEYSNVINIGYETQNDFRFIALGRQKCEIIMYFVVILHLFVFFILYMSYYIVLYSIMYA